MLEISGVGAVTAFAAGLISFLSPCVLPLVPGYVSYVAGRSLDELRHAETSRIRLSALVLSSFFVLGFSSVFIALGASATAIGQLLLSYRYEANLVGGSLVILFGLFVVGALRIPWLQREVRFTGPIQGGHPIAAYLLGVAFAFGWTPCIGPVLGAILTVSASSAHVANGVSLLAIYSFGLAVPFLAAAAFTATFLERSKRFRRFGTYLNVGAGVIMIAMGIAMVTGRLSSLAYWLLETFPIFGRIG
jgi:cytochrome c-type biogenesis protein